MMKILALILMALCTTTAAEFVHAAKPTALLWVSEEDHESGVIVKHYRISCSNSRSANVIRAGKNSHWCVAGTALNECNSTKMKAMKLACKLTSGNQDSKK